LLTELGRFARSFNTTLDNLERAEAQRQLVADASHELRTPIASLRANIQTLEGAERLPAGELESLRADILEELHAHAQARSSRCERNSNRRSSKETTTGSAA
jgi:signal transduction histidine kinase